MSAQNLFSTDGQTYTPVLDIIATLPRSQRTVADLVWKAIVQYLAPGSTELRITDAMLGQSPWLEGYSSRSMRRGLEALESLELIERERRRGLRTIRVLGRLKCRAKASPATKPVVVPVPPTIAMVTPRAVLSAEPLSARAMDAARRFFPQAFG